MHQTPFACLVSPGGGAFEIFARYVLKVLKFFIFILFSFFKNNWIFSFFHLKILRKNLESRVQSLVLVLYYAAKLWNGPVMKEVLPSKDQNWQKVNPTRQMHSHMQIQLSSILAKADETKPGSFWMWNSPISP